MHATHQFFLTKRSLYLLVLDARLEEEENRLEYWLKIIQSFGGNSPVIIIGNKADQQALDIDRRGLKKKYQNIKAIIETSCKNNRGLDKLKQIIAQEIDKLEHIYDPFPNAWFEVKNKLEQMKEINERDYIPYHEYEGLCNEQSITQERDQHTLIRFLHDLGIVLNFQDDERLEDTNVINPEWVTNGVYKILNDNALITEHKGMLERSMLNRILDPQQYPSKKHLFIINMMRKFELCFDIETDRKFLIPDLLPKEEPDTGEWNDALAFQYHYNVLPSSIISRFIVRRNNLISRKTYWRSGVVLRSEGNRALVKQDKEDKKIFIWIDGNKSSRRSFLRLIRSEFDYIHKTIPGIQAEEKIPLPKNPNILVDYKHLLNLEELGEVDFIPERSKEKVNVKELLDGIVSEQERKENVLNQRYEKEISSQRESEITNTPSPIRKTNKLSSRWFNLFMLAFTAFIAVIVYHFTQNAFITVAGAIAIFFVIVAALQLTQDGQLSGDKFAELVINIVKTLSPSQDSKSSQNSLPSNSEESDSPQKSLPSNEENQQNEE